MTEDRHLRVSPGVAFTAMLSVLLVGAGGTWLVMRNGHDLNSAPPDGPGVKEAPSAGPRSSTPPRGAVVTLTKEAIERAGIVVTRVSIKGGTNSLRLPGVVEPNPYPQ